MSSASYESFPLTISILNIPPFLLVIPNICAALHIDEFSENSLVPYTLTIEFSHESSHIISVCLFPIVNDLSLNLSLLNVSLHSNLIGGRLSGDFSISGSSFTFFKSSDSIHSIPYRLTANPILVSFPTFNTSLISILCSYVGIAFCMGYSCTSISDVRFNSIKLSSS